jgi:hypothetical protein
MSYVRVGRSPDMEIVCLSPESEKGEKTNQGVEKIMRPLKLSLTEQIMQLVIAVLLVDKIFSSNFVT